MKSPSCHPYSTNLLGPAVPPSLRRSSSPPRLILPSRRLLPKPLPLPPSTSTGTSSARTAPFLVVTFRKSNPHQPWEAGVLIHDSRDSQITSSVAVLNKTYASCGLSFVLAGSDRTINTTWYNTAGPGNSAQTSMKNTLRKGGAGDLNVYSVG